MLELDKLGLTCRDGGTKWVGCCPFHAGADNPNGFAVWLDEPVDSLSGAGFGTWDCFTRCPSDRKHGRVAGGFLLEPGEEWHGPRAPRRLTPVGPPKEREPIPEHYKKILEDVFGVYQGQYRGSPANRHMLIDRGLVTTQAGYGGPGGKYLLSLGFPEKELEELNLIYGKLTRRGKPQLPSRIGTDTMANRVVFPYTWRGNLTGLHGRILSDDGRDIKHMYTSVLGQWHLGCFNDAALDSDRVILVEGAIDAIAIQFLKGKIFELAAAATGAELSAEQMASLGVPQVVALGSLGNTWAMRRIGKNARLILAFDNDPDVPTVDSDTNLPIRDEAGQVILGPGPGWVQTQTVEKMFPKRTTRVVPPGGHKDWSGYTGALAKEIRQRAKQRRAQLELVPASDPGRGLLASD